MVRPISMRDLQKMSAGAIQALPHAVPIKSGTATVGILVPVPRMNTDGIRRTLARIDEASASYTPEEMAAIDEIVRDRGLE